MEINKRVCKVCGKEKDRILVGKFNHKDKKYIDETGKSWNGSSCPGCHKELVRLKTQLKRSIK